MWEYNNDYKKWTIKEDYLEINDFELLKQEYSSYRLYSKCLSGATYLYVNDTNDIYNILEYQNPKNWFISNLGSQYTDTVIPSNKQEITKENYNEYYTKNLSEYNLTLKSLFTPERLIKDSIDNFIQVDIATVESLSDLYDVVPGRKIDNITLKENHLVLIKNQKETVILPTSINPDEYFKGNYTLIEVLGTNRKYEYYNSENGLYKYTNNRLIRQDIFNNYEDIVKLSFYVKLGDINKEKQFQLVRLKSGYYPLEGDPIEFIENKNWIIRNRLDYNNLLDINYYDILSHDSITYYFKEDGVTYSIPERTIAIGEFGVILNNQSDISNIIRNKYKSNLRAIEQTSQYYWIIGDGGLLLKIRKHDFNIEQIKIDNNSSPDLKSISFYDELNGVIVGELNTILITKDGGLEWKPIKIKSFDEYSYNTVQYINSNNFYIGGNNGIYLHFLKVSKGWIPYKRRISKFIDSNDEYLLVDNINKIIHKKLQVVRSGNTLTWSNGLNDFIFIVCDSNKIIIHDIDGVISIDTKFIYLENTNDYNDITNIVNENNTFKFYFVGYDIINEQSGIFSFDISDYDMFQNGTQSNVISTSVSPIYVSDIYANSLYNKGQDTYLAANNSKLKYFNYSGVYDFYDIDSQFEDKLKSKLLFLDYDIAGKLNFFTDEGEYRLPNFVDIDVSSLTGSSDYISLSSDIPNWWVYYSDLQKTFEYYSENINIVNLNNTFKYYNYTYDFTISSTFFLKTSIDDIINLAPNISDEKSSKFYTDGVIGLTGTPHVPQTLYLYDNLMIHKIGNSNDVNPGDIIKIESDIINDYLVVNKVVTLYNNVFGNFKYVYFYTTYNESIIKSIKDYIAESISNSIKIKYLNRYNSIEKLIENFNLHPISKGYNLELDNDILRLSAKFNSKTAYYNLATDVIVSGLTYSMNYEDSFIKFGYSPTYNILDYLNNIDSTYFTNNKEYLSMPIYRGIPISASNYPLDECYIDENSYDNKLIFGKNLKFEWDSIFINTFVNINIYSELDYTTSTYSTTEELLVIKKYYDLDKDVYFIEFNKPIKQNGQSYYIDIVSRRKLYQISEDLSKLNNIQTNKYKKEYLDINNQIISYNTYKKEISSKFKTDSYAKILLSDDRTIESISGIIYIDYKGELSLNITKLENKKSIRIINTQNGNDYYPSFDSANKLIIICNEKHNLKENDYVNLRFDGGVESSQYLNNNYFGYRIILGVIDNYRFWVDVDYSNIPNVGNDTGYVDYIERDPFLNYQPIDIIDFGVDSVSKISVELNPDNTVLYDNKYKLVNVDYNKYRFKLIDGLDVLKLATDYSWIYESEIKDAIIGMDLDGLIWYTGIWECGRWFGGKWISGTWISGDWYSGIWDSKLIKNNYINIEVDSKSSNTTSSIWKSGRWFGGIWNNGTWVSGKWYDGTWNNGSWNGGTWNDGIWNNGRFTSGVWVSGTWNLGKFNTLNGPSYWLDGVWREGDFENGIWYDGSFGSKKGESRFGIKSYNSRPSIWKSGLWVNGSFHSSLNLDNNGFYTASEKHNYSIWETGKWMSGEFYGGTSFNIDFKSGKWYGGISEDIRVIGMTSSGDNYFILDGLYQFNIGDEISIIDNQNTSTYSIYGNNSNPGVYIVLNSIEDLYEGVTKVYVNKDILDDLNYDVGLRLVSRFRECNWKSGIWINGIYEEGLWEGGIWYNGIFTGTWM